MNDDKNLVAGIDLGGTFCRVSLYTDTFDVLADARTRIRDSTEPESVAQKAVQGLEETFERADSDPSNLVAAGLALAAQIDRRNDRVLNAPNLGWRDIDFKQMFENRLASLNPDAPVYLVNDLNAQLLGEHNQTKLAKHREVLAVYVGSGVGGAIMSNGEIVRGARGVAAEIGHVKVAPGGRQCGCGQQGCLEAYAGGIHLEKQVAEMTDKIEMPRELEAASSPGDIDLSIADDASAEITELNELWDRATTYLAVSIANAATLLNPEIVLLGGGVLEHCERFRQILESKIPPLVLEVARNDLRIEKTRLGEEAGRIGAALATRTTSASAR